MERMTVVTSSKLKAMFQGRMNGSGVRCHIFEMRVRRTSEDIRGFPKEENSFCDMPIL